MLKGTRNAVIQRIQPISIHGQVSLDVFWMDPEDPEQELRHARIGDESVPRGMAPGDKVTLHYLMGVDEDHELSRSMTDEESTGLGRAIGPAPACRLRNEDPEHRGQRVAGGGERERGGKAVRLGEPADEPRRAALAMRPTL